MVTDRGRGVVLFLRSSTLKAQAFLVSVKPGWCTVILISFTTYGCWWALPNSWHDQLVAKDFKSALPVFPILACSYFSKDAICIIHAEAQPSIKQKKAGNQHTDNMRLAAILFTYRTDVQLPSHLKSSSRSTWFVSSCLCLKHCLCTVESWTYSNSSQHTRQQLFLLYYCA